MTSDSGQRTVQGDRRPSGLCRADHRLFTRGRHRQGARAGRRLLTPRWRFNTLTRVQERTRRERWLRSPLPVAQPEEDVRRLGEALSARAEDVLDRTRSRTRVSGQALDPTVRDSFERICTTSTIAVAQWMVGGDPEVSRKARREAGHIFGQLAAQRAAPLNEVTKRGMYWRDAVSEVLRESAAELGVSSQALSHALAVVQFGLDVSLLRMCENSETERQRTDEELARRQEELERRQEELAFMATHDALTGLPNRTLILDRSRQMLMRARRHKTPVAVLFVGLDNFKSINETLSRGAGDELLRAVAERLDGAVRDTDALGRLGGDEFVVIAEELSLTEGPELIAERLQEALKEPFRLAGEHEDSRERDREHWDRDGRAILGRGAPARRGHRDAPGQVGRQEPLCRCSSPGCKTRSKAVWNSRWTCAMPSQTTSSSWSISRRSS